MAARRCWLVPFLAILLVPLVGCSSDSSTEPEGPSGPTDATAPMIVVTTPARSAMLAEGALADGAVSIEGEACDSTDGITRVNVLGTPVPVSGSPTCVPFDAEQSSRWGLSIVTADATSGGGATETLVQSYLRSPTYLPPASSPSAPARVPAAAVEHLNQDAIDDGDRGNADDVATIVQLAVNGVNWNAAIPTFISVDPDANANNVVDTRTYDCLVYTETNTATGYMVKKAGTFTRGAAIVEYIRAEAGKLSGRIAVSNLSLPLSVTGYLDLQCLGEQSATVTGSVLADRVVFTTTQHITVNAQGQLQSNEPTVTVQWTNLRLDIDWGPLSFISGLLDTITNSIFDYLEDKLAHDLGALAAGLIPGLFESSAPPSEVTLPAPIGTVLGVNGVFDSFTEGEGWVRLGIAAQFYPKSPVRGRTLLPYGALRKNGDAPSFEPTTYEIGAGVKDDALNQLLWAAWAGGAFDFDAVAADPCLAGLTGSIASIRAGLPPVLMPGRNGHAMDVGLGDLFVEYVEPGMTASADPSFAAGVSPAASFYVSAVAGIDIAIDAVTNKLNATLDASPDIHVQVVSSEGIANPAALSAAIEAAVRCLYEERIAAVIAAYPLPEFDIGSLGVSGVEPGTTLEIVAPAITRTADYFVLTGSLEAR